MKSETADVASLVPLNGTRRNIWSNSDIYFDIVQKEKSDTAVCFVFPQTSPMVHFSFVSLHPATRGTTSDTFPRKKDIVHKEQYIFFCCFHVFAALVLIYWIAVEAICSS